jgi:perosamine synthetase
VDAFEDDLRSATGATQAVAVSSGTAALHVACATLDLAPGDEVIVPALTFAASANAVVYCGGTAVFAEASPDTFCLDPDDVRKRLTPRTKAIMTVHYAGLPANLSALRQIAADRGIPLIEDAAHALGATTDGKRVGTTSQLATFSFHPVKHITTAEGGAIATSDAATAARMRRLRNHGLDTDVRSRERVNTWRYEMVELGWNYRLSDVGAALGSSQLKRLDAGLARRRELAKQYREAFRGIDALACQRVDEPDAHAWHIFPVALQAGRLRIERDAFVSALRAERIGANVHYAPTHLQPYYRARFGHAQGELPITEDIASRLVTLPLFPAMSDHDLGDVVSAVRKLVAWYG